MNDLARLHAPLREAMRAAFAELYDANAFILGAAVEQFEAAAARALEVPFAVGVSSGTDALLAALMALELGPGDEVITTPFTFFATAGAIARTGARPVFADLDPATFNLDPAGLDAAYTPRTRALIVVHLFGRPAPPEPFVRWCATRGVALLEDAAQSFGARADGRPVGAFGTFGCHSFFPAKNLGALGDGGLVTAAEGARAERLRALRTHGGLRTYEHEFVGGNFRLDALQARFLHLKLPYLPGWTEARRAIAAGYTARLSAEPAARDGRLVVPGDCAGHVWNQYTVRISEQDARTTDGAPRDRVRAALAARGIASAVYYPLPLHLQPCFRGLGYRAGAFPHAERAAREVLSLPIFPGLTEAEQEAVVAAAAAGLAG